MLGQQMPGRLGDLASEMALKMENGESLPKVLSSRKTALPTFYKQVLASGIESNQMIQSLESLTSTARRLQELRSGLVSALVYPTLLFVGIFALFVVSTITWFPMMQTTTSELNLTPIPIVDLLCFAGDWVWIWAPLVLIGVALVIFFCLRGWRVPVFSKIIRLSQLSTFCEVLSSSLESNLALTESILLASRSCGNRNIARDCEAFVILLKKGANVSKDDTPKSLTPIVNWLMLCLIQGSDEQHGEIIQSLRNSAGEYQDQLAKAANFTTIALPMTLVAIMGGGAVAFWAFSFLGPWYSLLDNYPI